MFTGLRASHITLIAGYWIRFSLRTGGGLMALFIMLALGLQMAAGVVTPVEFMMTNSADLGHTEADTAGVIDEISRSDNIVDVLKGLTGAKEADLKYLLREQPALLSGIWVLLLLVFPFMACISGFNQTAGEIGSRGLRYVLLRTSRVNVYCGRFLGAFLFTACSSALMCAVLLIYIGVKFNIYPLADLLLWGAQGYLALMLLALSYLALCAWVSAMLSSAFGALALCFAIAGGSIAAVKIANGVTIGVDFAWLELLLPWGWKYDLLSGDLGTRLLAYAVMIGFTGVFFLLGLRSFTKRDL